MVKAHTNIAGYFLEEISPKEVKVYFVVETDFKLSLPMAKQIIPRMSNNANSIRLYAE